MAAITVQTPPGRTGLAVSDAAVAANGGGDYFVWATGQEMLYISNASVGDITLSMTIAAAVDGVTPAAKTKVLTAGKTYVLGPFDKATYVNPGTGHVNFTYSGVTTLTLAVFQPF